MYDVLECSNCSEPMQKLCATYPTAYSCKDKIELNFEASIRERLENFKTLPGVYRWSKEGLERKAELDKALVWIEGVKSFKGVS